MFGILETLFLAHVINDTSNEQAKALSRSDAERAVIEAAKALREAERLPGTNERYFAVHEAKQAFNRAVDALQEAEDG